MRRRIISKRARKPGKRTQKMIVNNGQITFTYKEARKLLGINPTQFRDALDGLIDKGFLEIEHQGTGQGDPTLYFLSDRFLKWGTDDFKPVPSARRRRKNTSGKSGWEAYWRKRESQKPTIENDSPTAIENNRTKVKSSQFVLSKTIPQQRQAIPLKISKNNETR